MIYKTARQKNLSGSSVDEVYLLRYFSTVDDTVQKHGGFIARSIIKYSLIINLQIKAVLVI